MKKHWIERKPVLVLGNVLIKLTQTQSFQFTLFLNISVPHSCLHRVHQEGTKAFSLSFVNGTMIWIFSWDSIEGTRETQPLILSQKGQGGTREWKGKSQARSFARVYFGGFSYYANSWLLKSH